jgi:hypothetical protein
LDAVEALDAWGLWTLWTLWRLGRLWMRGGCGWGGATSTLAVHGVNFPVRASQRGEFQDRNCIDPCPMTIDQ